MRKGDLRRAARAKRHGARYALRIIKEARRSGISPALGFALCEKESGFRNIFGCDHGSGRAFCHKRVTRRRVRRLLRSGIANGVGYTQLTYPPLVQAAEDLGGAHRPKHQIRVGFEHLGWLIRTYGKRTGTRRYNGSGPAAEAYANDMATREARWKRRLRD